MVSARSAPTSHNRNETEPQATVVYVVKRLFVSESSSDFLDCVGDKPRSWATSWTSSLAVSCCGYNQHNRRYFPDIQSCGAVLRSAGIGDPDPG